MGPADLAHLVVIAVALLLSIAVFVRIYRAGPSGEEGRRYSYSIAEQQVLPQLLIVVRYVRRLALSWEYLLLLLSLSSLALAASYPLQLEPRYSYTAQPGQGFPEGALFLYSQQGVNVSGIPSGAVVKIYYIALGEPLVVQSGDRVLRAFSAVLVECSPQEVWAGYQGGWAAISKLCVGGGAVYFYPPEEVSGAGASRATLYYGDEAFNITLEPYPREVLRGISGVACMGDIITSIFRQMEYSGGIIAPASLLAGPVGADMPSIVVARGDYRGRLDSSFLSSLGAEVACYRGYGSGEVLKYVREGFGGASEHLYSLLAGVSAGFLMILFNRSLLHRIAPSSGAILISGGTAWISSIFPVVSLASMELASILVFISVYGAVRALSPPGAAAPISPPGVLIIVLSSTLVSIVHMMLARSRFGALYTYVERPIPARSYSAVVEGYSPRDLVAVVVSSLEGGEFFELAEKEVLEQGGRINARLRLVYRYSIGVGADVNIYASAHNAGSFIEVDVEPWSIDAREGGLLDTISRLILSRISGGIYVDKVSRSPGQG